MEVWMTMPVLEMEVEMEFSWKLHALAVAPFAADGGPGIKHAVGWNG